MNKRHDFAGLEREYVTSQVSLRELCRRHNISAHSLVTVQAKKGKWQEKREQYRAKADESIMTHHPEMMADRQAKIHDKITKMVRQPDGSVTEVPAWYMTPRDLCLLIDRFEVLFEKPSKISQHQGLNVTSELSVESLRDFIERTRGKGGPSPMEVSPLPRRARRLDD